MTTVSITAYYTRYDATPIGRRISWRRSSIEVLGAPDGGGFVAKLDASGATIWDRRIRPLQTDGNDDIDVVLAACARLRPRAMGRGVARGDSGDRAAAIRERAS